jgi:hypothetical protein
VKVVTAEDIISLGLDISRGTGGHISDSDAPFRSLFSPADGKEERSLDERPARSIFITSIVITHGPRKAARKHHQIKRIFLLCPIIVPNVYGVGMPCAEYLQI